MDSTDNAFIVRCHKLLGEAEPQISFYCDALIVERWQGFYCRSDERRFRASCFQREIPRLRKPNMRHRILPRKSIKVLPYSLCHVPTPNWRRKRYKEVMLNSQANGMLFSLLSFLLRGGARHCAVSFPLRGAAFRTLSAKSSATSTLFSGSGSGKGGGGGKGLGLWPTGRLSGCTVRSLFLRERLVDFVALVGFAVFSFGFNNFFISLSYIQK